jgi:hypothetical protein
MSKVTYPPIHGTPLHAYAPGAMAKLTPHQRGRALKRSKRAAPNAALSMPRTVLR